MDNLSMQIVRRVLVEDDSEGKGLAKNFIFSPFSLSSLLSMVASGLKGETFEKLMSVLGLKSSADLVYESSRMLSMASESDEVGPVLFSSVNGVWVDKKYRLKPSFSHVLTSLYKVQPSTLDFENKLEEAIDEVNTWVENATKGLIKEGFPKDYAKRNDLAIVLANALYFKGTWAKPFEPLKTFHEKFYTLDGESVKVPYMQDSYRTCAHGSFKGFKILMLPYKSGGAMEQSFSMYLFLPDEKDGLYDLQRQLCSDPALFSLQFELEDVRIGNLMIPKFKFNYGFEVTKVMEKMGVMISTKDDEMLEDIGDNAAIEDMKTFHTCCIEVNENGTEAAALTFCLRGGGLKPPDEFIADHPFVFMIREDSSQTPVFVGVVVNPLLE